MKRLTCIAATSLFAFSVSASLSMAQTVEKPVTPIQTGSGLLSGKVLASGVKAWFGVPYAKPPTQDLRWKPPQPSAWKGVWNADRKMSECIQVLRPHNINHYFGEEPTSEDCLYLNVWAPARAKASAKLPVIIFIHGGGYTIGSSGSPLYDGEQIAKRGAVFINLNYRLGILGFMAHPDLTQEQGGHSGNYALMDQSLALKWVHDNIEKFGGDPSRILITGQSAGAGSVVQQMFSPMSRGLFSAAMMSSACNWAGNAASLASGEKTGLEIQKLLGAANIDEMRQVPADKILSLQAENQVMANNPGVRTGPVLDGYFMPKTQMELLEAHEMSDVPIMAGSNAQDIDFASNPLTSTRTVAEYKDTATKMYGANAAEFLQLYPVSQDSDIPAVAGRAARDAGMQASSRKCAQLQFRYNTSSTYIDLYTHRHPYAPGVKIADQNPATIGAYHTADIPYWFGTLDAFNRIRSTRNETPADRQLSETMMDSLIAFAKSGNPSTARVKWPAWSASSEQRAVFGDEISIDPLDTTRMDWLAAHPATPIPRAEVPRVSPRD